MSGAARPLPEKVDCHLCYGSIVSLDERVASIERIVTNGLQARLGRIEEKVAEAAGVWSVAKVVLPVVLAVALAKVL